MDHLYFLLIFGLGLATSGYALGKRCRNKFRAGDRRLYKLGNYFLDAGGEPPDKPSSGPAPDRLSGIPDPGSGVRPDIYQAILDNACDLLGSKRGSIMVFDEASRELKIAASKGISNELLDATRLKSGEGIAGRAFQSGETMFIHAPGKSPLYANYSAAPEQQEPFIAMPLKTGGKPLGVLNIHAAPGADAFSDEKLKFLSILAREAAMAVENMKLNDTLQNFYLEMVETLARTIDAKDSYTHDHAGRARRKARRMAEALGLAEAGIRAVEYAALLHDIGKIGVRESLLLKPGRLSSDEYEEMKKHPAIGYQILSPVGFLSQISQMVLYHQEWFNGKGYPHGLGRDEIPLGARIVAIIDAWDAMVSDRPYRKALTRESALAELRSGSGKQFDPSIIKLFMDLDAQGWQCP